MANQQQRKLLQHFLKSLTITHGSDFSLNDFATNSYRKYQKSHKADLQQELAEGLQEIAALQDKLYAAQKKGLLIILQAMDAAGKDGTIKHVMGAINPQGCAVTSFKTPTEEEHAHDFLWRCIPHLPRRGMISIFNRSYYEEVLAVNVHPEWLKSEGFEPADCGTSFWKQRYASIADFEQHLTRNHTEVLKIFLHLSYGEQRKRLLARIDEPAKNWKFSEADVRARKEWKAYQRAYAEAIRATASKQAPWYIVPADNKSFARFAVMCILLEKLLEINPHYPSADPSLTKNLSRFRKQLEND